MSKNAHTTPSFANLVKNSFYPDILQSLSGYMEFMHEKQYCKLGKEAVEIYAAGYLAARSFSVEPYLPKANDPFFELKNSYLQAVTAIFKRFSDRLPRQFYEVLSFMALRENPTAEDRIPEMEHLLPGNMSWETADAVLHALPLCSRLYFDIQTEINAKTGRILGHGCGCSCSLAPMPTCMVNAPMGDKEAILIEETESFLRHLLGQYFLLKFGLPQGIGPSVKMEIADLNRNQSTLNQIVLKQSAHQ